MHERAIPQSFEVRLDTVRRWKRSRYVHWANGSGSCWRAYLQVSQEFLESVSLTMARLQEFASAINVELRRMDPDLAGSDLPMIALADHVEQHGEFRLAESLRESADKYFHSVRRRREYSTKLFREWYEERLLKEQKGGSGK